MGNVAILKSYINIDSAFSLDADCCWLYLDLGGYILLYQLPRGDNQGEARIAVAVIYITMPRWVQLEIRLKINTKPCQIWYNFFYLELHTVVGPGEISVNSVRCERGDARTYETHFILTSKTLMFQSKNWRKPFTSWGKTRTL